LVLVLALTFFYYFANEKDPAIILPFGSKAFLFLVAGRFLLIKKPKHCCLGSEKKIRIVIYSSPALFNSASGPFCPLKRLYKDIGCSVPL
jgi:hypothetical protein